MIPGHELIDTAVGPAVGELEGELQPGEGIDAVHLRRLQQAGDGRPGSSPTVRAGKQSILPGDALGAYGAAVTPAFRSI